MSTVTISDDNFKHDSKRDNNKSVRYVQRMLSCKRVVIDIQWEMSQLKLISQERICVGSSNLVDGLTKWLSMYNQGPKSQGHKVKGHHHKVM